MEVIKVIWCKHTSLCGQYSSAHVHRAIKAAMNEKKDGSFDEEKIRKSLKGLSIDFLDTLEGDALAALPNRIIKK